MAPVAAPTNDAATSDVMLGMISRNTIRKVPSPANFAAVTKSRLRRVMICARLARAAPAHEVTAMTKTMRPTPRTSA